MEKIYGKPLLTEAEIQKKVKELGAKITEEYEGKDLIVIGVLKGAYIFFADLVRSIKLPVKIDFLIASSYGLRTETSGEVKIISDIKEPIKGRDVLLIDDIVDSGLTMNYLRKFVSSKGPKSLKVCVLLDKPARRKTEVTLDYVGFTIPNKYVVGYGLDYQNKYRNLPYVAVLEVEEP